MRRNQIRRRKGKIVVVEGGRKAYGNDRSKSEAKRDKYYRYRHRLHSEGRCVSCGVPCAPYYYCALHRYKHAVSAALKRGSDFMGCYEFIEKGLLPTGTRALGGDIELIKALEETLKTTKAVRVPLAGRKYVNLSGCIRSWAYGKGYRARIRKGADELFVWLEIGDDKEAF